MLPDIVNFFIVLSVVVLIHELGHFVAAKLVGVKVEEFGLGYPPKAIGKKIGETIYSINWLPFGGFVRLFGEQEADAPGTKSSKAFFHKTKLQRTFVILAGVFMNLVLGVVCFSLIYSIKGIPEEVNYIVVEAVSPNSPAQQAGLGVGDKVLAINDQHMQQVSEFVGYLKDKGGQNVTIDIERKGEKKEINLTPRQNPPEGEGAVGVLVSNYDNIFYPMWQMPFRGTYVGVQEAYGWTKMMLVGLGTMVMQAFAGKAPEVAGPVGIYKITSTVAKEGIIPLIKFIGIFSINLAVVNVLPIPALDGGRFLFILIEGLIGKKIKPAIEAYINMAGMALLVGLMLLVTGFEVFKLIKGNFGI